MFWVIIRILTLKDLSLELHSKNDMQIRYLINQIYFMPEILLAIKEYFRKHHLTQCSYYICLSRKTLISAYCKILIINTMGSFKWVLLFPDWVRSIVNHLWSLHVTWRKGCNCGPGIYRVCHQKQLKSNSNMKISPEARNIFIKHHCFIYEFCSLSSSLIFLKTT